MMKQTHRCLVCISVYARFIWHCVHSALSEYVTDHMMSVWVLIRIRSHVIVIHVHLSIIRPVLWLWYLYAVVLPTQPYQKRAAAMSRRRFAAGTHSDHMALLRAFQVLQHFVSSFTHSLLCFDCFSALTPLDDWHKAIKPVKACSNCVKNVACYRPRLIM